MVTLTIPYDNYVMTTRLPTPICRLRQKHDTILILYVRVSMDNVEWYA